MAELVYAAPQTGVLVAEDCDVFMVRKPSDVQVQVLLLTPSTGYSLYMSTRYNGAWADWIEVDHFDVSDILLDKWRVV